MLIGQPKVSVVTTPPLEDLMDRAMLYLAAGLPVHLEGPSGTGKTTLALHLAARLGRPVMLLFGNDEAGVTDLIGGYVGMKRKQVFDQFIRSVEKRQEEFELRWLDGRLLVAAEEGYTLVYDEFTRSRPETNNVLLSVLEERLLDLPADRGGGDYLKAHPEFRAIFTSNPTEYAGVHKSQDALRDRMVTLQVGAHDLETEVAITASEARVDRAVAEVVVRTVRQARQRMARSAVSVRPAIMLARAVRQARIEPDPGNPLYQAICHDVLGPAFERKVNGVPGGPP